MQGALVQAKHALEAITRKARLIAWHKKCANRRTVDRYPQSDLNAKKADMSTKDIVKREWGR